MVGTFGVEIQDARAYSPRTVAQMSLEDAVTVAKAILAFAGEDFATPTEAEMEMIRQYEDGLDAKADAISAHFLHD